MDRSPSTKSQTEMPRGTTSAVSGSLSSSSSNGGGGGRRHPHGLDSHRHRGAAPGSAELQSGYAYPPAASVRSEESFSCPSEAVGSLEHHYAITVQQLERITHMYHRLDTHNGELEEAFVVLRTRLESFRSFLVFRLRKTADEVRSEVRLLRDTVAFLMQDFAADMQYCQQIILSRLHNEGKLLPLPPPFGSIHFLPGGHVNAVGGVSNSGLPPRSPRQQRQDEVYIVNDSAAQRRQGFIDTPRPSSSSPSAPRPSEMDGLREALDEALRQRAVLERKLHEQRESHEKHVRSMRDLYAQKECTWQRRMELLERLIRRDTGDAPHFFDDHDGEYDKSKNTQDGSDDGLRHSSPGRRREAQAPHHRATTNAWVSTSGAFTKPSGRGRPLTERGAPDDATDRDDASSRNAPSTSEHGSWASEEGGAGDGGAQPGRHHDQRHRLLMSDEWGHGTTASLTMHDELERRVRSQLVRGRRQSAQHPREFNLRPDPTTRREERLLEAAACRLLNVVGDAYATQEKRQKPERSHARSSSGTDVVERLYYLPRSPARRPETNTYLAPVPKSGAAPRPGAISEVSTVARGLWAEKLLQQRSARRPR
ncbi:hypothetical protein DQ04_05501010 [Trypanosoma grayi]|uniref:hypothetical protein n=1 Tax=Trypanosoma grayi TaxID=71804 RepID=UPI0004F43601|nr:hypothetical protein DQ04_05501010 [Trypanosoma grayi]KEG09271.1 hypothetical protein DQ04_05501010 [Trypanosoma grayi]